MLCSRQASQTVLNSCKNSPLYNLSPQSAHSRRTGSASFFIEELFTPQLLLSSSCCCTRSFSAAFQGLSSSASRASPKRCWFGDGNSAHWELPRIPSWDDGWKGIWWNPFRHLICFLFIFSRPSNAHETGTKGTEQEITTLTTEELENMANQRLRKVSFQSLLKDGRPKATHTPTRPPPMLIPKTPNDIMPGHPKFHITQSCCCDACQGPG